MKPDEKIDLLSDLKRAPALPASSKQSKAAMVVRLNSSQKPTGHDATKDSPPNDD